MSSRLKVAVVHYHFKPGGVTRVAEATCQGFEAIDNAPEFAFISGAPVFAEAGHKSKQLAGLGYTTPGENIDSEKLYFELLDSARDLLGGLPDVWHIHNHSLGKNKAFAGVVQRLAADGRPLLLHMHDFAEDGRPSNYSHILEELESPQDLYPIGEHIHYGLLNGRDYQIMRASGVPESNIHLLPNPIPPSPDNDLQETADFSSLTNRERLFLYPVRAVRRKNLGELAFWAALAPENVWFANTLGPSNPNYQPDFNRWIAKCKGWELPVIFELATKTDASFEQVVSSAEAVVSTSVAEGFGLGFLEPWTFEKPLIGRDLPEITEDFKEEDIHLNHLYQRVGIPIDFIDDFSELRSKTKKHFENLRNQYGQSANDSEIDAIFEAWVEDGQIDFGVLSEPFQESIISKLTLDRPEWAQSLAKRFFDLQTPRESISKNKTRIQDQFTPDTYSKNLLEIYQRLASASIERVLGFLEPSQVLSHFLAPSRFNLLRSS